MKKVLGLILCLAMSIGLVACSSGGDDESPEAKIAANATKGNIGIEVVSATITQDKSGEDAVVVIYNFINNTDKKRDFKSSVKCVVNQGSDTLVAAMVPIGDIYKDSVATKAIDPEGTLEVYMSYKLVDKTTPLKITCNILSGEDKSTIEKELPLA